MKTLNAAQVTEKEASSYEDVFYIVIYASSENISHTLRFATQDYTLSGNQYKNRIKTYGSISMSLRNGGGMASVGDFSFSFINTGDMGELADMYDFENNIVDAYLIFKTGSETDSHAIQIFSGSIQTIDSDRETLKFSSVDSTLKVLKAIPSEVVDLGTYPNAPITNMGQPLPVPFGDMDDTPFQFVSLVDFGFRKVMPCVCVDIFEHHYIYANCKDITLLTTFANGLFVYYDEIKVFCGIFFYDVVEDAQGTGYDRVVLHPGDHQTNRHFNIFGLHVSNTGGVLNDHVAIDKKFTTKTTLTGSQTIKVKFRGIQKLGTIVHHGNGEIKLLIRYGTSASSGMNVEVTHPKLSTINLTIGTGSDPETDYDIHTFSSSDRNLLDVEWDFHTMEVNISVATGSVYVYQVYLYLEVGGMEIQSLEDSEQIFARIQGYEDDIAQYNDGAAITSGGDGTQLTNPADQLEAILRDKRTFLDQPTANIDSTSFNDAVTSLSGWQFDWGFIESTGSAEGTRNFLGDFSRQMKSALLRTFDGVWKVKVMDDSDDPDGFFGDTNISVTNPKSKAIGQRSSLKWKNSSLNEVYNDFQVRYGWNYAKKDYDLFIGATGRYISSGTTATTNSGGKVFTQSGASFHDDFVLANHVLYARSGTGVTVGVYNIVSVDSATQVTVSSSMGASATAIEFYIGPFLDASCVDSFIKYGTLNTFPSEQSTWYHIQDTTTAGNLIDFLVSYYSERRWTVSFNTFWNAVDMELADVIWIDDATLPYKSQKQYAGCKTDGSVAVSVDSAKDSIVTINEDIGATEFDITSGGCTEFSTNDYIKIDDEVMKISSCNSGTSVLTVVRAQLGTALASHAAPQNIFHWPAKIDITGNAPDVNQFILIDNEVMKVTVSGSELTVLRAQSGSLIATHATGTPIYRLDTKWRIMNLNYNPTNKTGPISITCRQENIPSDHVNGQLLYNKQWQSIHMVALH